MKTRSRVSILVGGFLLLAVSLTSRAVFAFGESEDQIFLEDIQEARARAKDFTTQRVREATEDLARQQGAVEVKRERAEAEAEAEKLRRSYVKERNDKPSVWQEQARLERQFDEEQVIEEKRMDKFRRDYKKKRTRVRHLIDHEAYIDENQEYGL